MSRFHVLKVFFYCFGTLFYINGLQITGSYQWARDEVSTMQQACVDVVLMRNYSELNDTESLNRVISQAASGLTRLRCEPFDCSRHGRCVNGSCVCNSGMSASSSSPRPTQPATPPPG